VRESSCKLFSVTCCCLQSCYRAHISVFNVPRADVIHVEDTVVSKDVFIMMLITYDHI
jgi:hypothetical protein